LLLLLVVLAYHALSLPPLSYLTACSTSCLLCSVRPLELRPPEKSTSFPAPVPPPPPAAARSDTPDKCHWDLLLLLLLLVVLVVLLLLLVVVVEVGVTAVTGL
jgi:hypothetical protein